jgi:hypothetical protein
VNHPIKLVIVDLFTDTGLAWLLPLKKSGDAITCPGYGARIVNTRKIRVVGALVPRLTDGAFNRGFI